MKTHPRDDDRSWSYYRITLPKAHEKRVLNTHNILYCKAHDNQTEIHQCQGQHVEMTSFTLREVEEALQPKGFYRCHKSYLVNMEFVTAYLTNSGGYLELTNGEVIPVSDSFRKPIVDFLESLQPHH